MFNAFRTLMMVVFGFSTYQASYSQAPVKVFVLAGQSNMVGKAKVSLLRYQLTQPETKPLFQHLHTGSDWAVRPDVWISFGKRKGNLTVGYGSPDRFGPELGFGHVVGDHFQQQVLLIKTAWGGKSLYRDFRPPSAGLPDQSVLAQLLTQMQKRNKNAKLSDVRESFGTAYRQMLEEVRSTLDNLSERFPEYSGQGYELAGLVWFQGWNDMINDSYTAEYSQNFAHFIRDVRRDLKTPALPIVIGQLGVDGTRGPVNKRREQFKAAQAAVATMPEFAGNVTLVKTDIFWDQAADAVFRKGWKENIQEWEKVGSDYPYHYLGSAKTYLAIGQAFAEASLKLDRKQSASAKSHGKSGDSNVPAKRIDNKPTSVQRFYDPVETKVEGWTVAVAPELLTEKNQAEANAALEALGNHLQRIRYVVPEPRLRQLKKVRIWLDRRHPKLSNMQYHPSRRWLMDNGHDPRLAKHVHIPRAAELTRGHVWAKHPYVILHELAHALHDQILGFDDPKIKATYLAAKQRGNYESVLSHTGNTTRHYAMTDHKEYFAESTEAFFGVNDFYPFVRAELKQHDPKMHALMHEIWLSEN